VGRVLGLETTEHIMENINAIESLSVPGRLGRSVGAVLAGLVAIVVTHTGTDAILHATGVFPAAGYAMSDALFGLATSYRVVFSVLGAALTAYLAPARPLKHALVLGGIGIAGSFAGLLATFGKGPEFGPLWYPIALMLTSLPACWLGATLTKRAAH
jgi:MFS-type transporter involved in bile tolerance (Atg22 family)